MSERGRLPYGVPTNGLYTFKPYVYRGVGEDVITPDRPGVALRRRGRAAIPRPPQRRTAVIDKDGRCVACGYKASGKNHKAQCG